MSLHPVIQFIGVGVVGLFFALPASLSIAEEPPPGAVEIETTDRKLFAHPSVAALLNQKKMRLHTFARLEQAIHGSPTQSHLVFSQAFGEINYRRMFEHVLTQIAKTRGNPDLPARFILMTDNLRSIELLRISAEALSIPSSIYYVCEEKELLNPRMAIQGINLVVYPDGRGPLRDPYDFPGETNNYSFGRLNNDGHDLIAEFFARLHTSIPATKNPPSLSFVGFNADDRELLLAFEMVFRTKVSPRRTTSIPSPLHVIFADAWAKPFDCEGDPLPLTTDRVESLFYLVEKSAGGSTPGHVILNFLLSSNGTGSVRWEFPTFLVNQDPFAARRAWDGRVDTISNSVAARKSAASLPSSSDLDFQYEFHKIKSSVALAVALELHALDLQIFEGGFPPVLLQQDIRNRRDIEDISRLKQTMLALASEDFRVLNQKDSAWADYILNRFIRMTDWFHFLHNPETQIDDTFNYRLRRKIFGRGLRFGARLDLELAQCKDYLFLQAQLAKAPTEE